jgi:outer membrane murein-binding lipoprotein Lpp
MAAGGFTVRASMLASGSGQVQGLASQCAQLAGSVTAALEQLAASAGNAAVAKAAADAAIATEKQFLDAGAGYEYAARQLTETAAAYGQAEQANVAAARGATSGLGVAR